jgi:hypothetical protein
LYTAQSNLKIEGGSEEIAQKLTIRIDGPKSIAIFGSRWVYITIRNPNPEPVRDVKVWLAPSAETKNSPLGYNDVWVLPSLFEGASVADRSVRFKEIPGYATVSGRISLFATQRIRRVFKISWAGREDPSSLTRIGGSEDFIWEIKPWKSLFHTFLEHIMLPPWANGFIIASVLLTCTLIDRKEPEEEKFRGMGWVISTAIVALNSLKDLLVVFAILLTLLVVPWLDTSWFQESVRSWPRFFKFRILLIFIPIAYVIGGTVKNIIEEYQNGKRREESTEEHQDDEKREETPRSRLRSVLCSLDGFLSGCLSQRSEVSKWLQVASTIMILILISNWRWILMPLDTNVTVILLTDAAVMFLAAYLSKIVSNKIASSNLYEILQKENVKEIWSNQREREREKK